MKPPRLRPKVIIWWGIAVAVGGSLLTLLLPTFVVFSFQGSTGMEHDLLTVVEFVARIADEVLPPLGAALIGAGVVMLYFDKRIAGYRPSVTREQGDIEF